MSNFESRKEFLQWLKSTLEGYYPELEKQFKTNIELIVEDFFNRLADGIISNLYIYDEMIKQFAGDTDREKAVKAARYLLFRHVNRFMSESADEVIKTAIKEAANNYFSTGSSGKKSQTANFLTLKDSISKHRYHLN